MPDPALTTHAPQLFREIHRVLAKGGRAVISDIVSDEDVPAHLQADPELWSGCVSGAMREDLFLKAFEDAGLYGVTLLDRPAKPWRTVEGIEFRSVTVVAYKGKEGPCRDHKQAVVRVADTATGTVRTVFEETEKTHFESRAGWRVLWASNEIIWSSQRDNWSQLYLYDLNAGQLKGKITTGEGPVTELTKIDEKARVIWFAANGKEPGQDPYFRHYYRMGLDGKGLVSLTPDDGTHDEELALVLPATPATATPAPAVSSLAPDAPVTSAPSHQLEDDRLEMCFELNK